MQRHTLVYFKHYNIGYYPDGSHDFIKCEACGNKAIDIHHIKGRVGPQSDDIDNLIALCRECHNDAHSGELSKEDLNVTHRSNLH